MSSSENSKVVSGRELVDGMLVGWGLSFRRTCRVLPFDNYSYNYQSLRTNPAFLKKRIK